MGMSHRSIEIGTSISTQKVRFVKTHRSEKILVIFRVIGKIRCIGYLMAN